MSVTQIAEGIHRIESIYGGRNLYLYLFTGTDRTILADSGAAMTPHEAILPALEELDCGVDVLLVTHCDLDHQGGNAALRRVLPNMQVWCGTGDEIQVSDPAELVRIRYSAYEMDHGVGFPAPVKAALRADSGERAQVDRTLAGGERIALGDGWTIEVLHAPGHSKGHLAVYDPRSGACVAQDAVHGRDYPFADGTPCGTGTLRELMDASMPRLGKWDAGLADMWAFGAAGHLERYVDAGLARVERHDGILRYEALRPYEPPAGG